MKILSTLRTRVLSLTETYILIFCYLRWKSIFYPPASTLTCPCPFLSHLFWFLFCAFFHSTHHSFFWLAESYLNFRSSPSWPFPAGISLLVPPFEDFVLRFFVLAHGKWNENKMILINYFFKNRGHNTTRLRSPWVFFMYFLRLCRHLFSSPRVGFPCFA